jgi:UDP-N-acetylmuramate dehydrogenase
MSDSVTPPPDIPTCRTSPPDPFSLREYNSLGLQARAQRIVDVHSASDIAELSTQLGDSPRVILGSGTNVVLHAPLKATVLMSRMRGRHLDSSGLVRVAAGENWHALVMWSLERGLAGLENLALIPGTAGAAPVQNIGAYGVELCDVLEHVVAWDFRRAAMVMLGRDECQFSYRDSVFRRVDTQGPWNAPRFFITEIGLRLHHARDARLHTAYGELQAELDLLGRPPSARDVAEAVTRIRRRKLPDPSVIGNVGSFFKNPLISSVQARSLRLIHPDLPTHPASGGGQDSCKVPAAWLIERCGFKGARRGDVGVHDRHALVIVNHGGGTGREILALAREIQQAVVARFGIFLEPEPVFMPGSEPVAA